MAETGKETVIQGIAASPGVAHGTAFVFLQKELEIPIYQVETEKQEAEIARFESALMETRAQVSRVRNEVASKLGEDEAQIFDAHLLVLEDRALIEEVINEHQDTGYNIEYCFHSVSGRYIEAFDAMDDAYIKERVTDIRDVSKRVLSNLLGHAAAGLAQLQEPRIVVSEDISPSDTAGLDKAKVQGVITDAGSRTSHAVIMARSLGVPAVVGLHDTSRRIANGDNVLVDGYDGVVVIHPTEETLYRYGQIRARRRTIQKLFDSVRELPAETTDKRRVKLAANIGGADEVEVVRASGAEGVGLFRTEALFMRGDRFPSEEEQYGVYREVAEKLSPQPVIVRTLDLGGDKRLTSFAIAEEDNPFMGFRAIRFCLEHQEVFKDQLRAILRASAHGRLKLMYPMIGSINEIQQANAVLEEAKGELRERGERFDDKMPVGAMIEIPSAATCADLLAEHCDFFSIGTNDLIQYMLAVDRVNDRIAHLYEPNHPAVLRVIKHVIEAAHAGGIEAKICGEMAADPVYAPLLIGMGADELSVTASGLSEIKYLIRQMSFADAQELARKVLATHDPKANFAILQQFYTDTLGDALPPETEG